MTTTKHTPGPWEIHRIAPEHNKGYGQLIGPNHSWAVCALCNPLDKQHDEERDANAHLIAAAPELLVALEECVAEFDTDDAKDKLIQGHHGLNEPLSIEMARAAITKATEKETGPS